MNHQRWAAWLAIALPITVLFGPVLFTDRSFAFRDAAHFYYPLFEWCCGEWAAGRVPLWNPGENGGLPVLADASSSLFYPGKLIFALPVDFALRYKLYIVGHVLLAAGGSYWLARSWQASSLAAATAAMAYACGGGVVFLHSNVVFLVGAAWLPWAALTGDRMLTSGSRRAAVLLGVVLALMILGGDPQMAFHTLLIAGLYALVRLFGWPSGDEAKPAAAGHNKVRMAFVSLGLVGAAAIVGFLLAAVQVLPSSEATRHSERAAFNRPRNIYEAAHVFIQPANIPQPLGETRSESIARGLLGPPEAGHPTLTYDFSVGPWRLAEYFWPNVGGRAFPTKRRWFDLIPAEMRTWTPTLYLGLLPVLLALSCFRLRGGTPWQRWLSWVVLIFTLGSCGLYGVGWLVREVYVAAGGDADKLAVGAPVGGVYWLLVTLLPSYAYFRYPAKLLPLVSLGLSQLAAIGWDRAFAERRPRLSRVLLALSLMSGVAAFIVWCGGSWFMVKTNRLDPSLGPFDALGAYRDLLGALTQTALVAGAGYWLLMRAWSEPARSPQWQLAALALTALELSVANYWLVPSAPSAAFRGPSPMASAIQAGGGPAASDPDVPTRVFRGSLSGWRPESFRRTASPERLAQTVEWERATLFPKYPLQSDLALVESYGSIKLADYESLLFVARQHGAVQPDNSRLPQPAALRLLGTQYLVLPENNAPEFAERVVPDPQTARWPESAALWRMKRTQPRAWIVHEVETLPPLSIPLRMEDVDERSREVLFPAGKARSFSRSAVVETAQPPLGLKEMRNGRVPTTSQETGEICRITRYEPQVVIIEATLAQPGLVVLSDAWFPGWEATVRWQSPGATSAPEPRAAPILRTNRVLRGVWMPAGTGEIEMRYRPASFVRGAAISGVSWVLLVAAGMFLLIKRKRGRSPQRSPAS